MLTATLLSVALGCPVAPPKIAREVKYVGADSGCSLGSANGCWTGEQITVTAQPAFGYAFQPCDRFEWRFGASSSGYPQNFVPGSVTSGFSVPLSYKFTPTKIEVTVVVSNNLGSDGLTYHTNIPFSRRPCPPSTLPSSVRLDFLGEKSGCSRASAQACIPGEMISLSASLPDYDTPTPNCDSLDWTFAGFRSQVTDADAQPSVIWYVALGSYPVSVAFRVNGVPVAGLSDAAAIRIAEPPVTLPKKRAVRH